MHHLPFPEGYPAFSVAVRKTLAPVEQVNDGDMMRAHKQEAIALWLDQAALVLTSASSPGFPEVSSRAALMRVYFHATNGVRSILDQVGIEVVDIEQARVEARRALEEFRRELDPLEDCLSGWRLEIVDAAGLVVLTLDLD